MKVGSHRVDAQVREVAVAQTRNQQRRDVLSLQRGQVLLQTNVLRRGHQDQDEAPWADLRAAPALAIASRPSIQPPLSTHGHYLQERV